jgi:membrane fusion protein, heavy metal efflux system
MKNLKYIIIIALFSTSCKNKPVESTNPLTQSVIPQGGTVSEVKMAENAVKFTDAQLQNGKIQVGKAELRSLKGILKVNGTIDVPPQNLVSVSFPMGGYLKNTNLLPGMPIKKGQVIATLEDASYIQLQQDYLTVSAKLDYLQLDLARQQELNTQKINAEKTLQQVQSDYRLQQISQKGYAEKLRLIGINPNNLTENNMTRTVSIYSPISGYVSKVNVNIGKYLAPTDVMFQLVNTDDIHANLTVFEKDIPKLKIGQKLRVTVPSIPNKNYAAEIILIGRDLNENRAVEVHCHFENEDHKLSPGMFLSADIETTETNALTVPNDAVVRFENKYFIFIEKEHGVFDMIEVALGVTDKMFSQINPLSISDISSQKIVTQGAYAILSKMKNTAEE